MKEELLEKAEELLKDPKINNEIYWAMIKIYNENKSIFPLFSNEVDFASFIDNELTEKLKETNE